MLTKPNVCLSASRCALGGLGQGEVRSEEFTWPGTRAALDGMPGGLSSGQPLHLSVPQFP